ncbi:MAG TPA: hypothetical protein VHI78_06920 [Bacteroidales bacterium]|nr:hypothetical protein [Bacteroidales bacterium]
MRFEPPFKRYFILLFALGFSTILSQLIILREFLNVFDGNELITGLFLCIWMILTAAGSSSGAKFKKLQNSNSPGTILLIISCLPFLAITLLYLFESAFFLPGVDVSFHLIIVTCVIILVPVCFLSGILFVNISSGISEISGRNKISTAYGLESLGSVLAGILFSTEIVYLLSSFQLLAVVSAINVILFYIIIRPRYNWFLSIAFGLIAAFFIIMMLFSEKKIQNNHFKDQEVLLWRNSPNGNISVTSAGNQHNLYLNSTPLLYNDNYFAEEPIHYALLQHKNPENILVVSGGIRQILEVLKYPSLKKIDYVEISPSLIKAEQLITEPVTDSRVNIISDDARHYIKRSFDKYDAIILNTPDPTSAQINRFFTKEFFSQTRRILNDSGVLEISLSSSGNYMNDEALKLNGIIAQTLSEEYKYVTIIPGERHYYIASCRPVTTRIAGKVKTAGIENTYVNTYYIDDDLLEQRSNEILEHLKDNKFYVNSDLSPHAYFVQIGFWMKKSSVSIVSYVLIVLLLITLFIFSVLKRERLYSSIFYSSCAGASCQFLVIFIIQVIYGNMYHMLGLIIACYMTGLYAGSIITFKEGVKLNMWIFKTQIAMTLLIAILPLLAFIAVETDLLPDLLIQILLFVLATAIAFSAGLIFNIATKLNQSEIVTTAGVLYGIDLAGSAAGTILISMVLLPLLGILPACLVITGFVAISAARTRSHPTT